MENNTTELKGWKKYCAEQNISITGKRIFIDGLGGMAHGLFASLLIGCIINTIGMYVPLLKDIVVNPWASEALAGENLLIASKTAAYAVQGAAMACAIAYSMKSPPFVIYSCLAVGYAANVLGGSGGPLAVFFVTVVAVFAGKLVSKRTPLDIIVTPFVTIVVGVLVSFLIAPPHRPSGHGAGQPGYGGHRSAAVLHGHSGIRPDGHHPDPAHFLRGHLRGPGPGGPGRRRLRGRLLGSHGGLCGGVL